MFFVIICQILFIFVKIAKMFVFLLQKLNGTFSINDKFYTHTYMCCICKKQNDYLKKKLYITLKKNAKKMLEKKRLMIKNIINTELEIYLFFPNNCT